jgi:hypothetical protein
MRLSGKRARNIGLGDKPVSNQKIDDVVLIIESCPRSVDLFARNKSHVLKNFEDVIFVLLHGRESLPSSLSKSARGVNRDLFRVFCGATRPLGGDLSIQ